VAQCEYDQIQIHIEHLQNTHTALEGLLGKGLALTDATHVMLPYQYQTWDQVDGVIIEANNLIPNMDCSCPCIIIDPLGMRERLPFVRASLKRAVYMHVARMEGFMFIHAAPSGPITYCGEICRPNADHCKNLDDWIDDIISSSTTPSDPYRLHEAIRLGLSYAQVDELALVSGAVALWFMRRGGKYCIASKREGA